MSEQRNRSSVDTFSVSKSSTIDTDEDWETEFVDKITFNQEESCDVMKPIVDILPHEFRTQRDRIIDQMDRFRSHDLLNTRVFYDRKDGICGFIDGNILFSLDYCDNQPISKSSELLPEELGFDREYLPSNDEEVNFQVRAKLDTLEKSQISAMEHGRLQGIVSRLRAAIGDDNNKNKAVSLYINDDAQLILAKGHLHPRLLADSNFSGFSAELEDFIETARRFQKSFKAAKRRTFLQKGKFHLKRVLSTIRYVRSASNNQKNEFQGREKKESLLKEDYVSTSEESAVDNQRRMEGRQ